METPLRTLLAAAVGVAIAATLACSVIESGNELQCSTNADCAARGPRFAGAVCSANVCVPADGGAAATGDPWGCLSQTPEPSEPTEQIAVRIILYDATQSYTFGGSVDGGSDLTLLSYVPEPGASITACSALDPTCNTPAAGPVEDDDAGVATMTLRGDFAGFYQILRDGYVPAFFYPGARLLGDQPQISFPTSITSEAQVSMLQLLLGYTQNTDIDAGPGILSVTQFDCFDRHIAGVTLTASPPPVTQLYTYNHLPTPGKSVTSDEGSAVFVNIPAGTVTVSSMLPSSPGSDAGRPLLSTSVLIRHGSITLVELRPRAR